MVSGKSETSTPHLHVFILLFINSFQFLYGRALVNSDLCDAGDVVQAGKIFGIRNETKLWRQRLSAALKVPCCTYSLVFQLCSVCNGLKTELHECGDYRY